MNAAHDPVESALDVFQSRGILPFVGRRSDITRIVRFWRETFDAQGLRALLLTGEAGIGKSRMLDVITTAIRDEGGTVIHAKLRRDAGAGIAAPLADAIRAAQPSPGGNGPGMDDRLAGVIAAMQRIARLRPTIVVLEDVHVLADEAISECSTLLQALTDEAISVICVARTVDVTPRGILERYLVEEIALGGLTRDDLAALWLLLFGAPGRSEPVTALADATRGNPRAVGAALRMALETGALVVDNGTPGVAVDDEVVRGALERGVRTLAEGMTEHLGPQTRRAAEQLSTLGEILSREAAQVLLEDAQAEIDRLLSAGILAIAPTSPTPIVGRLREQFPASNFPLLGFTHSLMHRYFVEHARIDDHRLTAVIAGNAPLYSLLPFQLLGAASNGAAPNGSSAHDAPLPTAVVRDGVARAVAAAYILDESPNWPQALPVYRAAVAFSAQLAPLPTASPRMPESGDTTADEAADRREIEIRMIGCRLSLLRRTSFGDEYRSLLDRFLEITRDPRSDHDAAQRLLAFTHMHRLSARTGGERIEEAWTNVHELLAAFPVLATTRAYLLYLRDVAQFARREQDAGLSRRVEDRIDAALAVPTLPDALRRLILQTICPTFLNVFNSEEELRERLALLERLENTTDETGIAYLPKLHFLLSVGMAVEARTVAARGIPQLRKLGLGRSWHNCVLASIAASAMLGATPAEIAMRLETLMSAVSESDAAALGGNAGYLLAAAGVLRGDRAWAGSIAARYPASAELIPLELACLLRDGGGEWNDDASAPKAESAADTPGDALLRRLLFATDAGEAAMIEYAHRSVERTILRLSDLFALMATIDFVAGRGRQPLPAALAGPIDAALQRAVAWLMERRLSVAAAALLGRYGAMIADEKRRELDARIAASAAVAVDQGEGTEELFDVSMLGSITVRPPGGEVHRVRGARLRMLLALMVADRMLERPLRHREFCQIATGNQDAPDHARKVVNISVYRLREVLGQEAILTDAETPQLNPARVRVDLLDVSRLLADVDEALAKGALMRAHTSLLRAYDIIDGHASFPELNEPFFIAARKDFESRVRIATVDVARGLLFEDNVADAEAIVQLAYRSLPEEPELHAMLATITERKRDQGDGEGVRP